MKVLVSTHLGLRSNMHTHIHIHILINKYWSNLFFKSSTFLSPVTRRYPNTSPWQRDQSLTDLLPNEEAAGRKLWAKGKEVENSRRVCWLLWRKEFLIPLPLPPSLAKWFVLKFSWSLGSIQTTFKTGTLLLEGTTQGSQQITKLFLLNNLYINF